MTTRIGIVGSSSASFTDTDASIMAPHPIISARKVLDEQSSVDAQASNSASNALSLHTYLNPNGALAGASARSQTL